MSVEVTKLVPTFWHDIEENEVGQVPVNTSTYVFALLKLEPKLLIVIVVIADCAVNVNQTSYNVE